MMMKAQSQVISTVLLILVVITLVVIVIGFVVPFVKNQLDKGKCLDVTGQVVISRNNKYTCFNLTTNQVFVQVHIGENRDNVDGFVIVLGGASSNNYQVTNATSLSGITMYDGSTTLNIPNKNEERTYIIDGVSAKPETISVYPILKGGRTCEPPDILNSVDYCTG
jgi:hypothetical protein